MSWWEKRFRRSDRAFLSLHLMATLSQGRDPESIKSSLPGAEHELKADPEMSGMTAGAKAYLFDSSTLSNRVVQCVAQRVRDKPKRIQKVAFSRTICANQESDGP
jgi:hypothetical protein